MSSNPDDIKLEAGLKALKEEDYETAKTIFESIAYKGGDRSSVLQAQMGLVKVYTRSGDIPAALALCETLTQSSRPKVKQWAQRTLEKLTETNSSHNPSANSSTVYSPPFLEEETEEETKETEFVDFNNSPSVAETKIYNKSINRAIITANRKAIVQPQAQIEWRSVERAKTWQADSKLNLIPLHLLTIGTFFAVFCVLRELLRFLMGIINDTLVTLPFLEPIQFLYLDPSNFLLLVLFLLVALSPWLLDGLLINFYSSRDLSKDTLNQYSSESVRLLQRVCQQRHWKTPKLVIMPMAAPLAFSYGNLPRTARIVVSQGLLEQLTDEEIATIYASQLGHICHWDFLVMSLVLLVTIPLYGLYMRISSFGDKTQQKFLQKIAAILSSVTYILWCLLSANALWLSQLRLYYSDSQTASLTGNPNALVRALLKISIGIASDISKQEQINWQLESLNLLQPVGYHQAISLGSIAPQISFEDYLMWEYRNPYRWWFTVNNTHPLMGERIQKLFEIAKSWRLPTQLNFVNNKSCDLKPQLFFLETAPFWASPMGLVFAIVVWLIWQIAYALKILNLSWLYDDGYFAIGCMFIGFSIGTFIRINSFFPEITPKTTVSDEALPKQLSNPEILPIESTKVRLVGKLLGRRGMSNILGQDLFLLLPSGLVKLHHICWMGQPLHPQQLIGRQIIITGWLRRGATPWIDVQSMHTQAGKTTNSPHPIGSLILAVAATVWGAYILLTG
jgi:Zn-dependent protease with chaperone function